MVRNLLAFLCLSTLFFQQNLATAADTSVTLEATGIAETDHVTAACGLNGGATVGATIKISDADGSVGRAHIDVGAMSNNPATGARVIGSVSWNDTRPMPFIHNPHLKILYPILGGLNVDMTPMVAFKAGTVILGTAFTNNVLDMGLILSVGTIGLDGSGPTAFLGRLEDRQTGIGGAGAFPSMYISGRLNKYLTLDAKAEVGLLATNPIEPKTVATSPTTSRQTAPGIAAGTEIYMNAEIGARLALGEHSVRLGVGAEMVDIDAALKNIDGSSAGAAISSRALAGKVTLTWSFDVVPAK